LKRGGQGRGGGGRSRILQGKKLACLPSGCRTLRKPQAFANPSFSKTEEEIKSGPDKIKKKASEETGKKERCGKGGGAERRT